MCEWTDEWTLNISTCTHALTFTFTFTSTSICITEYNSQRGRQRTKAEKKLSVSSARVHWVTLFDRPTWRMSAACSRRGEEEAKRRSTRLSKLLTTVKFVCAAVASSPLPLSPFLSLSTAFSLCPLLPNTHNKMQKFN